MVDKAQCEADFKNDTKAADEVRSDMEKKGLTPTKLGAEYLENFPKYNYEDCMETRPPSTPSMGSGGARTR